MAHVLEPALALLLLDRHARGIYFAFQGIGPPEFGASPEIRGCQTERQALVRYRETRTYEQAADRMQPKPAILIAANG